MSSEAVLFAEALKFDRHNYIVLTVTGTVQTGHRLYGLYNFTVYFVGVYDAMKIIVETSCKEYSDIFFGNYINCI